MNILLYIIIFMMGTVFGSFLTLATYRIPLHQDIVYKHSYCPKCNHKLSFLDMIPVLSYAFLGGKCRYCKTKISPRYEIIEVLCGLAFVILAAGIGINIQNVYTWKGIEYALGVLYIVFVFLIAGIDKEHREIHKGVLIYGIAISALEFIYQYNFYENFNINRIIIYLIVTAILTVASTYKIKKTTKDDYNISLVIFCLIINFFTFEIGTILTIILTLLIISIKSLINKIINKGKKYNKKPPVAFYVSVSNAIVWIIIFLSQIGV